MKKRSLSIWFFGDKRIVESGRYFDFGKKTRNTTQDVKRYYLYHCTKKNTIVIQWIRRR